jgi:AcrR family transcriptional regulator
MPESRFRRIRKYGRASSNRIGEVAGVRIGSVYPYFPSKEGSGY